jgi:CHAT domain-containing protein
MRVADLRVGVLFYCVGEHHLYALLIDQKGEVQRFQLMDWHAAFALIDDLLEGLEGHRTGDETNALFNHYAFNWGKNLLPPASHLERFDVLVIIPHHSLHGVPFHAIHLDGTNQFLGVSHAITYCSSATLFTHCVDRNPARNSSLGVEFWTYALDEGGFVNGTFAPSKCYALGVDAIGNQTDQFQKLAAVVAGCFEEADVVAKPTRGSLKLHLSNVQRGEVLCIVAHGYYAPLISDHSGLLLGIDPYVAARDIGINSKNSLIFRDMPMLDLPAGFESAVSAELLTLAELKVESYCEAELVALFACSTGAGEVLSGGDVNSFAYQWLKIGTPSVLANLWDLDMEIATEYGPGFFRRWLSQRQPKAVAWQQTLKDMLARSPNVGPYKWATIALFGDWL